MRTATSTPVFSCWAARFSGGCIGGHDKSIVRLHLTRRKSVPAGASSLGML